MLMYHFVKRIGIVLYWLLNHCSNMVRPAACISPQSEDDKELYRNITSIHQRFLAFVACLIDKMQFLGISSILYWLHRISIYGVARASVMF